MRLLLLIGFLAGTTLQAQTISQKLQSAVASFEADGQLRNGIVSLYVMNSKTGATVFNHNGRIGLTPASSQKVITSTTALETLGTGYRFKTELAHDGTIANGVLNGNLYVIGYGDPSLGSWRYASTKEEVVMNNWIKAIEAAGIKKINGKVIVYDKNWESQAVPDGWTYDDMGNYYGAGASGFNWRENQYDIKLSSGKPGDAVKVIGTEPMLFGNTFINELTAGPSGSGDNAYIYRAPGQFTAYLRGTIPPGQSSFTISGSMPNAAHHLSHAFSIVLASKGMGEAIAGMDEKADVKLPAIIKVIHTHLSPPLDSLNYWFLKKSVNLYGEAFLKALDYEKKKVGSTSGGIDVVKKLHQANGIEETALRMYDGSGLSPKNRLTAEALTKAMQYARKQSWFSSFHDGLPDINGMRMKSGTMAGVKSFTGYSGDYIFAIIVNNYNGSHADIQRKMWRVLDVLK
ncbi:D-alanyl-D-alanine carboxypeptidase/D-alanyl-D-alanine endopeptidase [Aridibaculum aurantiacum]|uniref:D-alanyl-D-alanine carboxypeptidase/D-alanyl-D-alanine endopeptidase n=1 Tax=Aridibaculum aurantiacum TaxID=2810307 RepID=UPI001A96A0B4|nr:D-alanyl-D-alanine carboxypeptidase/D-alanyl-D-alanine-endopeptidase [Aridibaculum aurantiacum]